VKAHSCGRQGRMDGWNRIHPGTLARREEEDSARGLRCEHCGEERWAWEHGTFAVGEAHDNRGMHPRLLRWRRRWH
jgi:hypothetical protein